MGENIHEPGDYPGDHANAEPGPQSEPGSPYRETDPKSSKGKALVLFAGLVAAAAVIWFYGN